MFNHDLQTQIDYLEKVLAKSKIVSKVLELATKLELPNWYLGAGAICQTVWNELHGFPLEQGIKDFDLVYFDTDISSEAQDRFIQKAEGLLDALPAEVELTNEARVHLWEALRGFANNAKLRNLSLAYMLDYAIEETYFQIKPAFIATLWPTWALGISRALDNFCGYFGFHFAGRLMKRFGAFKTLFSQQIIGRINIFVSAGLPTMLSPLLLNVNSFFFGVGVTANGALIQQEFTDKQRATMGSLNSLGGSILFAIVTVGAGFVADRFGPAKTILVLGLASVIVVGLYGNLFRRHGRDEKVTLDEPVVIRPEGSEQL